MGRRRLTQSSANAGPESEGDGSGSEERGREAEQLPGIAEDIPLESEMGSHEAIPPASHALKDTDVHEDKAADNRAVEAEMDKANETLTEDSLRREQRVNSVKSLSELRMKPYSISRLMIPLCRMVAMPMVRLALQCDLTKLENEFVNGYRDGSAVFYVSVTNEQGEEEIFSDVDKESWSPLWHEKNDEFNAFLIATPGLEHLQSSKFFVCDGNHRLLAWRSYISRNYSDKKDWHVVVDSIILETKGRIANAMHAMHDINKQTENSFIKTSLVHTLYRVRKYGVLPLDKFVEHLSASQMSHCKQNLRKSWYKMSIEVFTSFIFRYEIAAASDLVGRVYKEETPLDEQTTGGIIDAMQNGSKDKASKLVSKMGKLLAVANPILGSEWLQQLVATATAKPEQKVKWLHWWNSSIHTREAQRFPLKPVGENELKAFLGKACWYAGIEEVATEMFDNIVKKDQLALNMDSPLEPESLVDYIED